MKQSINVHAFKDAFRTSRPDNFSYTGLDTLFDYLEQLEEGMGEGEMELDVVGLCCEYSEMTLDEVYNDYIYQESCGNVHVYQQSVFDAIQDDPDNKDEILLEWLNEQTTVIPVDDDTVIIQQF